jgi:DNA processing protein
MMKNDTILLQTIALLQLPNVGRKSVIKFLTSLQSPITGSFFNSQIPEYSENEIFDLFKTFMPNAKFSLNDWSQALSKSNNIMKISEDLGIKVFGIFDEKFPRRLKKINDPPAILYALGNAECIEKKITIAVVGTRKPTIFGERSAEKIGKLLAKLEIPVVSGLAEGCDAFAQQGCVENDGETIAVLAHGLDQIYPKQNDPLSRIILKKNGCLISEYPLGIRPNRFSFVDRDRIQSGLSDLVIVIETGVKGGTMHTVKYSLEQNRILGCLKHPNDFVNLAQSSGNQLLISKKEAFPIFFDYFNKITPGCKEENDETILSFIKKLEFKRNTCENSIVKMSKLFNEFLIFENFSLDIDGDQKTPSKKKRVRKQKSVKCPKNKSADHSQKELH